MDSEERGSVLYGDLNSVAVVSIIGNNILFAIQWPKAVLSCISSPTLTHSTLCVAEAIQSHPRIPPIIIDYSIASPWLRHKGYTQAKTGTPEQIKIKTKGKTSIR
jgi:hypothetical protein